MTMMKRWHGMHTRDRAIAAFNEDAGIVHRRCGVYISLEPGDAMLLQRILVEQVSSCEGLLYREGFATTRHPDPFLQYLTDKVIPQITVACTVLQELREEIELQTRHLNTELSVVTLHPTRLQMTFLLQAVDWIEYQEDGSSIVSLSRYRLSRTFTRIASSINFEFDFWLASEYIDRRFDLTRPC